MDKKEDNKLIKQRIIYYLDQKNMSLNFLASESNITQSTLNSIINGNNVPTITTIRKICDGLHVSLVDFLNFYPYNQAKEEKQKVNEIKLEEQVLKMSEEIEALKKILNERA